MSKLFEKDTYPGKPRILFVGVPHSSHTHAWINLLRASEINVRLFAMPSGCPPPDWPIKTYITFLCDGKNTPVRKNLYRGVFGIIAYYLYKFSTIDLAWQYWGTIVNGYHRLLDFLKLPITPEAWLAAIIRKWQPDIIHTLGLFDQQGGLFYYQVRQQHNLAAYGKWILQLRGGSDLTLRRHNPDYANRIREALSACHQIITDNVVNMRYAKALQVPVEKFAPIVPVPGTGGIDIQKFNAGDLKPPSERERMILWPKADGLHGGPWSDALPVLEAIRLAWPQIAPCKIYLLRAKPHVKDWFLSLPSEIRQHCILHEQIPRAEVLNLLQRARVLLAPSLVDGVPNSLYEAMACGAFPIVSPLETIHSVVADRKNVLFARNLYPNEIANALILAMTNDELVDTCAIANLKLVTQIANRDTIQPKVIAYYQSLMEI